MRGGRPILLVGTEAAPAKAPFPLTPLLGLGAIGLAVVAVVRDERRASREKW